MIELLYDIITEQDAQIAALLAEKQVYRANRRTVAQALALALPDHTRKSPEQLAEIAAETITALRIPASLYETLSNKLLAAELARDTCCEETAAVRDELQAARGEIARLNAAAASTGMTGSTTDRPTGAPICDTAKNAQLVGQVESLRSQLEAAQRRITELECTALPHIDVAETMQTRVHDAETKLRNAQIVIDDRNATITAQDKRIAELEAELEAARAEGMNKREGTENSPKESTHIEGS